MKCFHAVKKNTRVRRTTTQPTLVGCLVASVRVVVTAKSRRSLVAVIPIELGVYNVAIYNSKRSGGDQRTTFDVVGGKKGVGSKAGRCEKEVWRRCDGERRRCRRRRRLLCRECEEEEEETRKRNYDHSFCYTS